MKIISSSILFMMLLSPNLLFAELTPADHPGIEVPRVLEAEEKTKQQEIVATEEDQKQIRVKEIGFNSTSKVILNQEAIRKSRAPNVTSLLANTANIAISNSAVQPGSIYLRGGDSGHVLILVDGLPFYDPSTVQRTMNLNELDVRSIRRIEIIKGSQSVLYGGQALTGVIKIETLPLETESRVDAQLEAGTREYGKIGAHFVQGLSEDNAVLIKAARSSKANASPVLSSFQSYWNHLSSGEIAYVHRGELFDAFSKVGQIYDINALTESDPATYRAIDSYDYHSYVDIKSLSLGFIGKKIPFRPKLTAGIQNSRREFVARPTADQDYGSSALLARLETTVLDLDSSEVQFGASSTSEKFIYRDKGVESVNAQHSQYGLFAKALQKIGPRFIFEAGARSEMYQRTNGFQNLFKQNSNSKQTFQFGLTWDSKYKFEYATGFKAPSLFQKYSVYGNEELRPETAETITVSADQKITNEFSSSITLFQTTFNDLITTQGSYPTLKYYNVSKAVTRGGELQANYKNNGFKVDLGIGYQEPWDVNGARWLLRRPLQTQTLRFFKDLNRWEVGAEILSVGRRLDRVSSSRYDYLNAYTILNLSASFKNSERISSYLRINNLSDLRYEESIGYHNEGLFALIGSEVSF